MRIRLATVAPYSALKRTANEGTDYETMWGSPVVTEGLIKSLKAKGVNCPDPKGIGAC
ncbi:MAG: hypothetical protein ACI4D6_11740 [Chordicoccus sp.]